MKNTWLVAVVGLGLAGSAHAQFGPVQKPVSIGVRAGAFMPKNKDLGKTWLAVGADVRVNLPAVPIVGGQTIAADYLSKGSSNMLGITLVQRFTSPIAAPVQGGIRPYAGLGFGYYRTHAEENGQSSTKSSAGLKVMGGLDIGQGLYVQGDYHLPAGRAAGFKGTGLAITAGVRF